MEDALHLLAEFRDSARILAGGQSLIPLMKMNMTETAHIVDLKRIGGLSFITTAEENGVEQLNVGPLTRHVDLAKSAVAAQHVPLLSEAASLIGHPLVRNRGTIGGSLAQCYPTADLCVAALALDAHIFMRNSSAARSVSADEFFVGPMTSALEPDEIIERITFPLAEQPYGWSAKKFTLGHADFPLLVVSTLLSRSGGRLSAVSISVGGLTWRPVRATELEEKLMALGSETTERIEDATRKAAGRMEMEEDPRLPESYRRKLLAAYLRRSVLTALERCDSAGKRRFVP